jgi:hypothetical protein
LPLLSSSIPLVQFSAPPLLELLELDEELLEVVLLELLEVVLLELDVELEDPLLELDVVEVELDELPELAVAPPTPAWNWLKSSVQPSPVTTAIRVRAQAGRSMRRAYNRTPAPAPSRSPFLVPSSRTALPIPRCARR